MIRKNSLYRVRRDVLFVPVTQDRPTPEALGHDVILRWSGYSFEIAGFDALFDARGHRYRYCIVNQEHMHLLEKVPTTTTLDKTVGSYNEDLGFRWRAR